MGKKLWSVFLLVIQEAACYEFGSRCRSDAQCQEGDKRLSCVTDTKRPTVSTCQCAPGLDFKEGKCSEQEGFDVETWIALLVPILIGCVFVLLMSIGCCYWVHLKSIEATKEQREEAIENLYGLQKDLNEVEAQSMTHFGENRKTSASSKKVLDSRKTSASSAKVPEIKLNGVKETSLQKEMSGSGMDTNGSVISYGIATPSTASGSPSLLDISNKSDKSDGYKANLRLLLSQPQRMASSAPTSRPVSANSLFRSRPNSAYEGPPLPNGYKHFPGANRPYLTENGRNHMAPVQVNTNLAFLFEKMEKPSEGEKEEEEKAKQKNAKTAQRRESLGIEEIKLAKTAVEKFKNFKFRNQKPKENPKNKLETLVDQIMKAREEANMNRPNGHPNLPRTVKIPPTLQNRRSSSVSTKSSTDGSRPESVAQRVLRARLAKNIKAKAPVTPPSNQFVKKRNGSSTNGNLPLHLALKQSTSKHPNRIALTERIKQQAHLSVVKNYAPTIYVPESDVRPKKSILKKPSDAKFPTSKSGKVNLAFKLDNEESVRQNGEHDVIAQVHYVQ